MIKLLIGGLLSLLLIALLIIYHWWEVPLTTPLTQGRWLNFSSSNNLTSFLTDFYEAQEPKVVYGFLPYWNVDKTYIHPELTHLSYFGLEIGKDGSIITRDSDGNQHPGYGKLHSDRLLEMANQVFESNGQYELTLVQFDGDTIVSIINNPDSHQNLIDSLDSILLSAPISGINIDIEYVGKVTPELRENFASMIEKISNHLNHRYDKVTLSIDMYASASDNKQLWDVPRIAQAVDYVVVMAYDYHRRGSPQAGPVAPLFGGKDRWSSNIHQHLREYLRYIPKEKILLGIPFYGYGWQTDSHSPQANSYPNTGFTASYKYVQQLLQNKEEYAIYTGWDDQALSPYLSYEKDDKIYMIYYENKISIKYKVEYAKQLDLAGIAIWALGYEGDSRELWDVIGKL